MMDIYNDGIHVDPDAHESDKVRKIGANLFIQWLKILYRRGKTIYILRGLRLVNVMTALILPKIVMQII